MASTADLSRQEPGQALAQETDQAESQEMNSWFPLADDLYGDVMCIFSYNSNPEHFRNIYNTIMYIVDALGKNMKFKPFWKYCFP